ncbi:MAG: DUF3310 domain-containing protein [Patescibacteria group bacterium]|nr:DUF3310 domain-containing protein [Patescibacteria group bacterium]
MSNNFPYKYSENEFLYDLEQHIKSTYSEHYTLENKKQALEIFSEISLDMTRHYCLSNALKYLIRYGKKEGRNYKDLLKAAHCIALLAYYDHLMEGAADGC